MALNLGELYATLDANTKPLTDKLRRAGASVKAFADHFSTLALTGIATGVGFFAKSIVTAASDLNETSSKIDVLFGKSSASVKQFAATASNSLGQSQQAAEDALATFAVFGKQAGLSGDKLVGFSEGLDKLSGDMASFFNTSPADAMTAITSALQGQSEPIRAYGVLLDQATIEQRALKMGLIKTTKEGLTPQQRVLATQAEIFAQTKSAQGDFARTSSGLANQQRILTAKWENAKAALGKGLLPIVIQAVNKFGELVKWGKANQAWVVPLVVALGTLAAVIYTIVTAVKIWTVVQTALDVVMDANPIMLIVIALIALVAGIIYAWKHSETFRKVVLGVWHAILGGIMAAVHWITRVAWPAIVGAWHAIAAAALWLYHKVIFPVAKGFQIVFAFIWRIVSSFVNLWRWAMQHVIAAVVGFVMVRVRALGKVFTWLWDHAGKPLVSRFVKGWHVLGAAWTWLWVHAIKPAIDAIVGAWNWLWGHIIGPGIDKFKAGITSLGDHVKSIFNKIGGWMSDAWTAALGFAKAGINDLIGVLNTAIHGINYMIKAANKVPGVNFPMIPDIPKLAHGGKVNPSPGGTPVIAGDGGQVEYFTPRRDMEMMIGRAVRAGAGSGAGGADGMLTIVIRGDGTIMRGIRKTARIQGGKAQTVLVGR